jgi:phage FluMu protein Com
VDFKLKDVKCFNCGTLVAKADIIKGAFSIKCRKCGTILNITSTPEELKSEARGYQNRINLRTKG